MRLTCMLTTWATRTSGSVSMAPRTRIRRTKPRAFSDPGDDKAFLDLLFKLWL
jgi:hypothetical protein